MKPESQVTIGGFKNGLISFEVDLNSCILPGGIPCVSRTARFTVEVEKGSKAEADMVKFLKKHAPDAFKGWPAKNKRSK